MKKRIIVLAVCLWAIMASFALAQYYPVMKSFNVIGQNSGIVNTRAIYNNNNIYVSIDDILKRSGYELGWEPNNSAVIVYDPFTAKYMYVYTGQNKIWDGSQYINYSQPFIIHEECLYIPLNTLEDLTFYSFIYELRPDNNLGTGLNEMNIAGNTSADNSIDNSYYLSDLYDYDMYRRKGNVVKYNGISLLDGYYAFESINITDDMAVDYALAVNMVASKLPEYVNVYNMAIPNSSEYYAPKPCSTNLKRSYDVVYKNLSDRVTPVDIYNKLFANASDYIFFNTDHHWTQRGAYYAYEEFMKVRGTPLSMNYLQVFGRNNTYNIVGSFANLMNDTPGETYIRSNPETLERFLPPYNITKEVYEDCKMEKFAASGPLINTGLHTYGTFLGGDVPVVKLHNQQITDGSVLCIIKDSYANAFATWAACDYEYVYLVDIRCFNGANGITEPFDIATFQRVTGFRDLLIMSYPNTISDFVLRDYIKKMA